MLTQDQVNFYHENGFLRIPQVFTPAETDELADELDLNDAQFLLVAAVRRHGRAQGRDHGERNGLRRVDLQQRVEPGRSESQFDRHRAIE